MKEDVKPIQQKLRKFHPSLEPQIQEEFKKLLDAKIIFEVTHFAWVANLVLVRNMNGEIRLCLDFMNLNKSSKKDNYPLPQMEKNLQLVLGLEMFSLLDRFLGHNLSTSSRGG